METHWKIGPALTQSRYTQDVGYFDAELETWRFSTKILRKGIMAVIKTEDIEKNWPTYQAEIRSILGHLWQRWNSIIEKLEVLRPLIKARLDPTSSSYSIGLQTEALCTLERVLAQQVTIIVTEIQAGSVLFDVCSSKIQQGRKLAESTDLDGFRFDQLDAIQASALVREICNT